LSLDRLHLDPTHLIFAGAYATSQPRPATPLSAVRSDAQLAPAPQRNPALPSSQRVQSSSAVLASTSWPLWMPFSPRSSEAIF
jgi:hypothetical protein